MSSIYKTLLQPYPVLNDLKKQVTTVIVSGFLVATALFIFKPFGFNELNIENQFKQALVYGGITSFCLVFLLILLPKIFTKAFEEEQWNVLKEIIYTIIILSTISVANAAYTTYWQNQTFQPIFLIRFWLITVSVGIFPIFFVIILKYKRLITHYKSLSNNLNQIIVSEVALPKKEEILESKISSPDNSDISENIQLEVNQEVLPTVEINASEIIKIVGDHQTEFLEIELKNLLYIKSSDNYIQIYFLENNKLKSKTFRSTLKKIEDQFISFSVLKRCHRGYFVNVLNVNETLSSAQGLKLILVNVQEQIPVSKTYLNAIIHAIESKKVMSF